MRAALLAVSMCAALFVVSGSGLADTIHKGNAGVSASANYNSAKQAYKSKRTTRKTSARRNKRGGASKARSARRGKYLAMARSMKPRGLPISLVDAVISMESGYRPNARGRAGEIGLMQIKPATARMVRSLTGVRGGSLSNPRTNLRIGMAYLNWCRRKAKGNVSATIGCYNAGPGNMWKWQKFAVTRKYVRYVRDRMRGN